MKDYKQLMEQFRGLSPSQQESILSELLMIREASSPVLEELEAEVGESSHRKPCPHCKSQKVYKRGKQKGVQMYQCRECDKWYSQTTGTPLWDIKKKEKWQHYLECMQRGTGIKKTAEEVGISIQTSFDWRHKILSTLGSQEPCKLGGTVECDEMELSLSKKGDRNLDREPRKRGTDFKRNDGGKHNVTTVQVVAAVDRDGNKFLRAVESKRLTAKQIRKAIGKKLSLKSTLITDEHPSFKKFAGTRAGITHKTVNSKDHVNPSDRSVHVQRVNNAHKQLRDFLSRFNGVSSKYLQNYLNWYAYGGKMNDTLNQLKQWFCTILASDMAYNLFLLYKQNAVLIRT
ncbi:MAG: IS1595 family transposase [Chitinophagales bacterium]